MYSQLNVLIIDDSPIIQKASQLILQKAGFVKENISTRTNVNSAINECKNKKFDIFLVDYNLGKGSTGLQFLEKITNLELVKNNPIIFIITAEDSKSVFMEFSQYQPDDYIIKPLRVNVLLERLLPVLSQRRILEQVIHNYECVDYDEAKFMLNHLTNDKNRSFIITKFAEYLTVNGTLDKSHEIIIDLLTSDNYLPARIVKAEIEMKQGKFNHSLETLTDIINLCPNNLRVIELQSKVSLYTNNYRDSYNKILKIHNISPDNRDWLLSLCWLELTLVNSKHLGKRINELYKASDIAKDDCIYNETSLFISLKLNEGKNTVDSIINTFTHKNKDVKLSEEMFLLAKAWGEYYCGNNIKSYFIMSDLLLQNKFMKLNNEYKVLFIYLLYLMSMYSSVKVIFKLIGGGVKFNKVDGMFALVSNVICRFVFLDIKNKGCDSVKDLVFLVKDNQTLKASELAFNIWKYNKYDLLVCRVILELYSRKLIELDEYKYRVIVYIKEFIESHDDIPEWYINIRANSRLLNKDFIGGKVI